MRIVSGIAGGRRLEVPKGRDIRPTSDKVRGAIFNALNSRGVIVDARVIDCFCGSGALGLEAISRGAASAVFIDDNRKSLDCAKANAEALGFKAQCKFILKDALKLKEPFADMEKATLVFIDPPYNKGLAFPALEALRAGGWMAEDAMCVVETEKAFALPVPPAFQVLDEKVYGDTKVVFLQYCRPLAAPSPNCG